MSKFHAILAAQQNDDSMVTAIEAKLGFTWDRGDETFEEFLSSASATEARECCEDLGLVEEEITAADAREAGREILRARIRDFVR